MKESLERYEQKHSHEWTIASLKKVISYWIPKEVAGPPEDLPLIIIIWSNFFLFLDRKNYFPDAKNAIVTIQEVAPLMLERAADETFWSPGKTIYMEDMLIALGEETISMFEELADDFEGMSSLLDFLEGQAPEDIIAPPKQRKKANNVLEIKKPLKRANKIYQVRIDIQGAKPPIWRRLLIPAGITFETLHQIIQTAFQWNNSHLHCFETKIYRIEPQSEIDYYEAFGFKDSMDSANLEIDSFIETEKGFVYEYDFGDSWNHIIKLEAVLERSSEIPFYPYCLKGKMHQPIDDVGGIWGYEEFVEKVTEIPLSDEGAEMLEWYTEDENSIFDPSEFDRDLVNNMLEHFTK